MAVNGECCALPAYISACNKHGVKRPNPKLVHFFQDTFPVAGDITEIDLSNNYIGNRGILAIMDVIESTLPSFRTLNISNQKLYNTDLSDDSVKGNATMDRVVEVLKNHSCATALDVSNTPISNYVGRKLLGLAQLNPRICRIVVDETRIDFDLRRRIKTQCERNTSALWENQEADEAAHPQQSSFGNFTEGQWEYNPQNAPDLTTLGAGKERRNTIRAEGVDPEKAKNYVAPIYDKPEEDIQMIVELLTNNVLFSFLGSRELRTVALAMVRKEFMKDDEIMSQGGIGDALFVIQTGSCDIIKEGQKVFLKTPGTAVGELELMYNSPCVATVKVCTEGGVVTWMLDRDTYRNLVMGSAIRRREEYAKHIEKIPFLQSLSAYEKMQVADALSSDEWQGGDTIIRYDEEGEWMFIILEGVVEVFGRKEDGSSTKVCDFTVGDYVGELEFLNNHRTVADVVAQSFVRTAKLNRRHFEMCMGPVMEVLKRNMQHEKYDYYQRILQTSNGSSSDKA